MSWPDQPLGNAPMTEDTVDSKRGPFKRIGQLSGSEMSL